MENSERPAFVTDNLPVNPNFTGLTKRELIASMAMQGILSNPSFEGFQDDEIPMFAIRQADELLKQLDNEK